MSNSSSVAHRPLSFTLEHQTSNGRARAATIKTAHSTIHTPIFMPVATHAIVRGQHTETLRDMGFPVLLANTFHLLLRPGPEIFREFGGIHQFMKWPYSILTDSGGYQIFSLARFLRMSEEGAIFRSYIDGKKIFLSPEVSIETQRAIGSDIMMVLDQCLPSTSNKETIGSAVDLTYRWAKRCLAARGDSPQALFGIIQGGCFPELRKKSADQLTELSFDGFAIGGLAVGEEKERREDIVEYTAELMPKNLPRYFMGVGTPLDLLEAVARGMDMFDCILPLAFAQQGVVFTSEGKKDLKRGRYSRSQEQLDSSCNCPTCLNYTKGYLHHLIKVGEFMGGSLLGVHNLHFYANLMKGMREAILTDSFDLFYHKQREELGRTDGEYREKKREKEFII